MGRLELKYLVPNERLAALRRAFEPFVAVDHFASPVATAEYQQYTVRSIYFDTPGLACYYQKEAGLHTRRKLRVRGYGGRTDDSLVVLEIKRKRDMQVSKSRAFVHYSALDDLLASGQVERHVEVRQEAQRPAAERDARAFLFHLHRYAMFPVVLVAYEREAFFGRFDPRVRVTFDKGLRGLPYPQLARLYAEEGLCPAMAAHFILEVKFAGRMPPWAAAIIEDFGLERRALSKFSICLEGAGPATMRTSRHAWSAYRRPGCADSSADSSAAAADPMAAAGTNQEGRHPWT